MALVMRVLRLRGQSFGRGRFCCVRLCAGRRINGHDACHLVRRLAGQLRQQFLFDRVALLVNLFERRINVVHVRVIRHHLITDEVQDDFGHAARRAVARALKDHVEHGRAAQVLNALLAEHPSYRIGHVTLAAAVGANDAGDACAGEDEVGVVREGLEACDL